jgi:RNA polymerase sigma-70 factor (ECF subfamily)
VSATPLASVLLSGAPANGVELEEIERALHAMVATARARWPDVVVRPAVFVEHLAKHVARDEPLLPALVRIEAADLYLAIACTLGDPAAMAAFERELMSHVVDAIARVDRSADFVAETRQRLYERLFVGDSPRIADYAGAGPLIGWLRIAAIRTALNLRRDEGTHHAAERLAAGDLAVGSDMELAIVKAQYGEVVEAALQKALSKLSPEDRHLLRLHHLDHLTLEKIAGLHKVNRSTVSRWLARVRAFLLDEIKRELAGLQLNAGTLDSLVRAVGSDLDVSLHGLLRAPSQVGP